MKRERSAVLPVFALVLACVSAGCLRNKNLKRCTACLVSDPNLCRPNITDQEVESQSRWDARYMLCRAVYPEPPGTVGPDAFYDCIAERGPERFTYRCRDEQKLKLELPLPGIK